MSWNSFVYNRVMGCSLYSFTRMSRSFTVELTGSVYVRENPFDFVNPEKCPLLSFSVILIILLCVLPIV
jgi:hypothetical protein